PGDLRHHPEEALQEQSALLGDALNVPGWQAHLGYDMTLCRGLRAERPLEPSLGLLPLIVQQVYQPGRHHRACWWSRTARLRSPTADMCRGRSTGRKPDYLLARISASSRIVGSVRAAGSNFAPIRPSSARRSRNQCNLSRSISMAGETARCSTTSR